MKPLLKPRKELSKVQKELLKTFAKSHSKRHIGLMNRFMKEGFCFQQAYQKALAYLK